MDAISYSHSAKQARRIKKFIENPDSTSGIVTVPKVIEAGENITIPSGRVAVLPNIQVDGTLNVEAGGEIFIPAGANISGVVEKQTSDITVDVGVGQTYTTINQALEYLSTLYPVYKNTGITATINLKAGFIMAEQVLVRGIDLGWITIVGEDAETIIAHTALTTNFTTADYGFNSYPAFGVSKGGVSPRIGQLFHFNVEKVGGAKHGIIAVGAGSSADVPSSCGFIGAGDNGIYAIHGATINANNADASNAGANGIYAVYGATINANNANASNAGTYGIYAYQGSTINASGANASNAGTYGIYANAGSTINGASANVSNAGNTGIYAIYGSTINASGANASNTGTYGIYAYAGSTINAQAALIQNQTTGTYCIYVKDGSTIEASGINTTGGTVPALSQTANTLTGNGIIYQ